MELLLEYGCYGMLAKPLAGALWRASFGADGRRYAGSADSPWEAIAWALVEREERTRTGNAPMMARNSTETPLQALERSRYLQPIASVPLDQPLTTPKLTRRRGKQTKMRG